MAAAGVRVSQGCALALVTEPAAGIRATQGCVIALVTQPAGGVRIGQGVLLALAHGVPRLTQWAQCWRIERRDGKVFAFTSHDLPVDFDGTVYQPCDSLAAGAAELGSVLGQVGNVEIAGMISDDAISEADLLAGLFDNARVEVWMVPWK